MAIVGADPAICPVERLRRPFEHLQEAPTADNQKAGQPVALVIHTRLGENLSNEGRRRFSACGGNVNDLFPVDSGLRAPQHEFD